MPKSDPEGAVRLYMMYLVDPNSLRDEAAIAKAEAAVEKAKDPIDRLKAMAARDRAQSVDGEQYRQDFIANAIYDQFFRTSDAGLGSALTLLLVFLGSAVVGVVFTLVGTGTLGFAGKSR